MPEPGSAPVLFDDDLLAPPAFAGQGTGTTSGSTLFGTVPDDDDLSLSLDDSASGPTPPRSSPSTSGDFGLDDLLDPSMRDLSGGDLDLPMPPDGGGRLDLDLPAVSRASQPAPFAPPKPPARPAAPAPRPAAPAAPVRPPAAARPTPVRPTVDAMPIPTRPPGPTPTSTPRFENTPAPVRPTAAVPRAPGSTPIPGSVPARPTAAVPAAPGRIAPPPPPARPPMPRPPGPPPLPQRASSDDNAAPDLPVPVAREQSSAFKPPTVDLPTPARSAPTPFRVPEPPPMRQPSGHTPLQPPGRTPPMPAPREPDFARASSNDMISVADLDLPSPAEIDLPMPLDFDLPAPADVDLLVPTQDNLPVPADVGLLEPADLDVEPAHNLPQPANLDVQPADGGLTPRKPGAPVPRAIGTPGSFDADASQAGGTLDPLGARRSPTPRSVGSGGGRRALWLALGGIGVIGVAAGGLFLAGVFDPPIDDAVLGTRAPKRKDKDGKAEVTPAAPGVAVDRSPDVASAMAQDTPAGYVAAFGMAEKNGDAVGQAEAALLLDLRYGPDSVRVGQATTLLQPFAGNTEPFVKRVNGLLALSKRELGAAETSLVGDDLRTRLYRGFLRLAQSRPADAITEAEAVLAAAPAETAALVLGHAARVQQDPVHELPAIVASLEKHPDHPGLRELGARAAIAAGHLGQARTWLDGLGNDGATGKGHAAALLRLRAELDTATGSLASAASRYDEAIALAPDDLDLLRACARARLAAGLISEARTQVDAALVAHPDDVELLSLQAELAVESGEGDKAKTLLAALETKAPNRARTSYLLGNVHAMRLEVDEARASYNTASTRDPSLVEARIAEAKLLAEVGKLGDGIGVLDTARKLAADRKDVVGEAKLLVAKGRLLTKAGQNVAAIAAFDQAMAVRPTDNAAQLARGLLRLAGGEYADARADLLALYERTGRYDGLTAPLGRIFVREGKLEDLEKLVGDSGDNPHATPEELIVASRLRLAQGRTDEADALLGRILGVTPHDWEANLLLAQAMLDSTKFADALIQIDRSNPPTPVAEKYLLRGKILEYNAKHDEARQDYRRALAIDPELIEARFLYGRLLSYAGESEAAEEELVKVTAATDKFPVAFLELGQAQDRLGEQAQALANLKRATELDPSLFMAHYAAGRIHYNRNEFGSAIAEFTQVKGENAEKDPAYADALFFLGKAQQKEGQTKAAMASYKKFLEVAKPDHTSRADAQKQLALLR